MFKKPTTKKEAKELFITLGWLICELKYLYYQTDGSDNPVSDQEYDKIEKLYEKLGNKLGVPEEKFASKRVGIDIEKGAGRIIHERYLQVKQLPELSKYIKRKKARLKRQQSHP